MIIGKWILMLLVIVVAIGEVRYRYLRKSYNKIENEIFNRTCEDNVDVDLERLSMECVGDDFVSSQRLAMRGSWRLAQNQMIGLENFNNLKNEEYRKML